MRLSLSVTQTIQGTKEGQPRMIRVRWHRCKCGKGENKPNTNIGGK